MSMLASAFFVCALVHTFSVKRFAHWARAYAEGSVGENVFHTLAEVEVVFGLWSAVFLLTVASLYGDGRSVSYLESLNFTEPAFVFAIMTIAATRPVLDAATALITVFSRLVPLPQAMAFYIAALVLGPLLGSFITEPAAMAVTALILKNRFYDRGISQRLMYATLGLLFVNVSIGGTLTHFAAPPVLMVAGTWQWDLPYMMTHFGWKAAIAVVVNALMTAFVFRRELLGLSRNQAGTLRAVRSPAWVIGVHLVFLAIVVMFSHHMVVFLGVLLFFLGFASVTREYQEELKIREALLVAFFLGGLVVLGSMQSWWLSPLLTRLEATPLFLGATALTAITDNAALTYLGSLVPGLSEFSKYALVAGAVTGGGLTVIANAPNPAGYAILNPSFGKEGISPMLLLTAALAPTLIAGLCFWFLPSL